MRSVYIILPSPHPTGPIKGAIALANIVSLNHPTTIFYLKRGPGADTILQKEIRTVSLANQSNPYKKLMEYKKHLISEGKKEDIVSISFCFSADLTNLLCLKHAIICSSVRGNLPINYQYEFGKIGFIFAAFHLFILRWFDHVVAMNSIMARQIKKYCGKTPHIVGNFVDEKMLSPYRNYQYKKEGPYRFIYLGRLTELKRVHCILDACKILKSKGYDFHLDIVGYGELYQELLRQTKQINIEKLVVFHGHLKSPYALVAQADCLVLPSFTEGVSRSVLEALYLKVPCLVRNIDGNSELIKNGKNGYLFESDEEMSKLMIKTASLSRNHTCDKSCFLPDAYRQNFNTQKFIELINGRR